MATTGVCIDAGAIMHRGNVDTPYAHFASDLIRPMDRSDEADAAIRAMHPGDTIEQNEAEVARIIEFGSELGRGGNGIVFQCTLKYPDGHRRPLASAENSNENH